MSVSVDESRVGPYPTVIKRTNFSNEQLNEKSQLLYKKRNTCQAAGERHVR